ncbi:phage portal protein family protein [Rufibacter ruber]|uniref:phage portal protein family protein n=1 Tax=Rufibacter ruber TaxID=1783499 RepID=UPI0008319D9C|nr:DUF935 family protein [Rufibacter ruber]
MNILSNWGSRINNFLNKPQPEHTRLDKNFNKLPQSQARKDVQDLNHAIEAAGSIANPSRYRLYQIYTNILNDPEIYSQIQSRFNKTFAKDFKLVDKNGKEDAEKTALFKTSWFRNFMKYALEAQLYGHSLIQMGDIQDGKLSEITLVDRFHVKPELGLVVASSFDVVGVDYREPEKAAWNIEIDECGLGVLLKVAKILLYKDMILAANVQFAELFGMPLRVGKTDMQNQTKIERMKNMLDNAGAAGWMVVDETELVEFIETTKGNGEVFQTILTYIDNQIAKVIQGQTMTSNNGSSKAQATVHEGVAEDYAEADQRKMEFIVNDLLIPKLIKHGYPLKGLTFQFDTSVKTSLTEKFTWVKELLNTGKYEIPEDYIIKEFGIPVIKSDIKPAVPVAPNQDEDTAGNF